MFLGYNRTLTLSLIAAVATGVALSQSVSAGAAFTLNGSLVSGGVATFDKPRRVIVTSAANESANSFTIIGTDYFGRTQTEVLVGANIGAAQTVRDFATVSSIRATSATSGAVTAGTSGVASTSPWIVDAIANPANFRAFNTVSGTVNYSLEIAGDDLAPDYNINSTPPTYFSADGFSAQTGNTTGLISGPFNFVRLTINSGTGTVTSKIIQSLKAGAF